MSKGKPYPQDVIDMARRLYLEGSSFNGIARAVGEATQRPCTPRTISLWEYREGWTRTPKKLTKRDRVQLQKKTSMEVSETIKQLQAYRKLWEKGSNVIDSLPVTSISQAVELIDVGIKGERRIMINAWMRSFLDDIGKILFEEIKDEELLKRIGLRFRTELKDFRMKE